MTSNITLTRRQQQLVEQNLTIVDWVITDYIKTNESIVDLCFEDVRQEGYVWLCHAAATYDGKSAAFGTYARSVVRNGLISYCRKFMNRPTVLSLDCPSPSCDALSHNDTDKMVDSIAADQLFQRLKLAYSGSVKLGIEALELKVKGLDGTEIAKLYGVPNQRIHTWVSRAVQNLRTDKCFLAYIQRETAA